MSLLDSLRDQAASRLLAIAGWLNTEAPGLPEGTQSIVLLAPAPDRFWQHFSASDEYLDGAPDPMDRWSRRVIGTWADQIGATALFPFGGPPYLPFLRWAEASGRAWQSPTGPLVHDSFGMMISYRGALALPEALPEPAPTASPCDSCADTPCLTACPVGALSGDAPYDVPRCKAHIRASAPTPCAQGCLVRRACPASLGAGRAPAQSAYHMAKFLESP